MFTDWYEPGFKAGGPIQACKNVVASLMQDYEFYVLCSDRDLGDRVAYPDIPANQWIKKERHVNIWYASPGYFMGKHRLLKMLSEVNPDFIYFNSMYSFKYTLFPLWVLLNDRFRGQDHSRAQGHAAQGCIEK